MEKFDKQLNHLASSIMLIFHPLIIPTVGFWIIFQCIPGSEFYSFKLTSILLSIVFVASFLLPFLFLKLISLGVKHHAFTLNSLYQRTLPYLFLAFSLYLGVQFLGKIHVPGIFRFFLLACNLIVWVMLLIKMFWNISDHTIGIGGLIGALTALSLRYGLDVKWVLLSILLIAGVVGSSQLYLEKHTQSQVYAGYFLGILGMFLMIVLL